MLAAGLTASMILASVVVAQPVPPPLPAVIAPQNNPITEAKRVLGKALFWDEQLSGDSTMSCGSCHTPARGGGDVRRVTNPGDDLIAPSGDDVFASPGVVKADASLNFRRSTTFGSGVQVTDRASPTMIGAAYFNQSLFWDGRATSTFVDPQTGATVLQARAALESQAVRPILNDVEMAHSDRNWDQVATKLASAKPLAMSTNIPVDLATALANNPSYAALFAAAFGDRQITAARIGMALATYQRTLLPDQTDFDRFIAGVPGALNAAELRGWQVFNQPNARCINCHTAPLFSDQAFHALGVRPPTEDMGRAVVTGNINDRGKFKTPTLRNAGLRTTFFHNGQQTNLADVMRFYARAGIPQFTDNQNPQMPQINLPPQDSQALVDFITGALTDPRVAAQTFPFDKPTIWQDRAADRPTLIGTATNGTSGQPRIIAIDAPMIGSTTFRLGVQGRANSTVTLQLSTTAPANNQLTQIASTQVVTTDADGLATVFIALPAGTAPGVARFARFVVTDPLGAGGTALTQIARYLPFCPSGGCPSRCPGDIAGPGQSTSADGERTADDIILFISWFTSANLRADIAGPGPSPVPDAELTADDIILFMSRFFEACV